MESVTTNESEMKCPCDSVEFRKCKVVILKELLEESRISVGSLKSRYLKLLDEQHEVCQELDEHKEARKVLEDKYEKLKSDLEEVTKRANYSDEQQECLRSEVRELQDSNEELKSHIQSWNTQLYFLQEFLLDVKGLVEASDRDDNENEIKRSKQFTYTADATPARQQYEAIQQKHKMTMKSFTHVLVPILLIISTIFMLHVNEWGEIKNLRFSCPT